MLKSDALILLIKSLSKAEKKSFKMRSSDSDYIFLFDIITANPLITSKQLRKKFAQSKHNGSFDVCVSYLYKLLLDTLLTLRRSQDKSSFLFDMIFKAKILFERSLFDEAFYLLTKVKKEALKFDDYYIYVYAARLELNYLLFFNFTDITETELLNKHLKINEALKLIRKTNEQSSLYELLRHRIIYQGKSRSKSQINSLNDLVVSEMSIISSSGRETFEIKKTHQLFQSNYLISVGDYRSALHSYYELDKLFKENKHLWGNPPYYYLQVIEGILDNLRGMKKYDELPYFIKILEKIKQKPYDFQLNVDCLIFLYNLFPLLDTGNFQESHKLIKNKSIFADKILLLNPTRQAELSLYTALVYMGLKNYKEAHKRLLQIITRGKSFYIYPLYRTIRLVNLLIQYELGDQDLIKSESRSIKREIAKDKKGYKIENLILKFINIPKSKLLLGEREKLWNKLQPILTGIREDVFENQLIKLFDFTAWIEAKLCKLPLEEVLKSRHNNV